MPARLVINPIVIVDGVRKPKIATLTDPGRAFVPRLDGDGDPTTRYGPRRCAAIR